MNTKQPFQETLRTLSAQEIEAVSGGLVSFDGDLNQFPKKFWPVINPGAINIKNIATKFAIG
ncbi:hypothetical protein ACQE3E_08575 [Methylomonas sp. MED-D]|uniref:Bacteriocin n=1 Tax=Methylomonas koyamae TaxID=702114 RepID=A0A177NC06_9GAMM|nr:MULTISPECIES: hypothetical protein [Methylomonas]MDT4329040.1 hypothetical protein [Methylomonas sp. MV1]NJA04893.1 hypothetical protein [Methylococcaceae bacterium WWC4]OAI14973.1 hypothetical protein A1355_11900 [Methylomonas koyamae]WGS87748.1 hypothetical protein QC632_08300 [Methylomonas sp. UP202]